jgi:hypothetical protein
VAPRQRARREEHAGLRVRLQHEQGLIVAAQQHEIQAPVAIDIAGGDAAYGDRQRLRRCQLLIARLGNPDQRLDALMAAIAKVSVVERYRLSASYH